MKSLEEELGCQLFRRQGKKFSITEAGDRLRFARPYLAEMQSIREELSDLRNLVPEEFVWGQAHKPVDFFCHPSFQNLSWDIRIVASK